MAGNLTIRLKAGCTPDTATMVLSGTAEPNGGDHYAIIDWGFHPVARILSIELEVTPGVWIAVPSAFLFSHLGEEYNLRASGPDGIAAHMNGMKFPYKVYGLYAPDWASVYGVITATPDDSPCCTPTGESTTPQTIWFGTISPVSGYPTNSACVPQLGLPYTYFTACAAGSANESGTVTPSITIYDWVDKAFSVSSSRTYSGGVLGVSMSVTFIFTITKVAGNSFASYAITYSGTCTGTLDGVVPAEESTAPDTVLLDIPCSAYKIQYSITHVRFGVGATNLAFAQSGTIVLQFIRP